MQSFLNVITLQTYTFSTTLTPRVHGRSKRFFRRPQNLNAPRTNKNLISATTLCISLDCIYIAKMIHGLRNVKLICCSVTAGHCTPGQHRHEQGAGSDRRRGGDRSCFQSGHHRTRPRALRERHLPRGMSVVGRRSFRLPQEQGESYLYRQPVHATCICVVLSK